jgi:hypothetical protein
LKAEHNSAEFPNLNGYRYRALLLLVSNNQAQSEMLGIGTEPTPPSHV